MVYNVDAFVDEPQGAGFVPGNWVKVKPGVNPTMGWGHVCGCDSVGVVQESDRGQVTVDFYEECDCRIYADELGKAEVRLYEGHHWHPEFDTEEEPLSIGVVINENGKYGY